MRVADAVVTFYHEAKRNEMEAKMMCIMVFRYADMLDGKNLKYL